MVKAHPSQSVRLWAMTDTEQSYEANTVEELREELRARDLPVSGHKEELIARLEEDDAGAVAADAPDQSPPDEPPDYYPPRVYNVYELPAATAAAQAFIDAHPDQVERAPFDDADRQAAAENNIQVHIDQMAAFGIVVEDPRVEGYVPPAPEEPAQVPELEEANS